MKRLLFIIYLMFIVLNIMAYQPMLIEGHIWTITISGEDTSGKDDNLEDFVYYKTIGDSTINGEIYKKVYKSSDKINWNLEYLMMENTEEQKVWKYHNNNKNLIFDFTLNVGDRFKNSSHICNEIKYIKDQKGNILKRMDFEEFYWIEGYGYEYIILDGVSYYLSSVEDENGFIIDCSKGLEYYNPMVVEGYIWNIVNRNAHLTETNTTEYYTYSEKIEGDSIVNDITYKKLWRSTNDEMTEYKIIALVREDIKNQKVWAYVGEKEYLIYDFACKVGDKAITLKSLQSAESQAEEVEMTIKTIEEIEDFNGVKYNKYIATIENQDIVYYERFGSENGWYSRSYDGITGGGVNFMICAFDETGELKFKPVHNNELDEIENCYINETKTNIDNVEIQKASLKKVMHDGQLYIIHEGKTYNIMGIEVENMNFDF